MTDSARRTRRRDLMNQCDQLWQKVLAKLARHKCVHCGNPLSCSHHVIRRAVKMHRWNLMNGVAVCHTCHHWAENYREDFLLWLQEKLPRHYKWHMEHRNDPSKGPITIIMLEKTRDYLKEASLKA